MHSSGRLLSSIQAPPAHLSKSLFVCSTCRQQFRPRALRVATSCRNASGSTPFTEKVRQKIWGTENPPGLKDPYGGEGFVEKMLRKRRGEEAEAVEPEPEPEPEPVQTTPPEEYVAATTWEGLEEVGTLGQWQEAPKTDIDHSDRFMPGKKLTSRDEITAALHLVMVELSLLRQLDKPLSVIPYLLLSHSQELYSVITKIQVEPSADKISANLSFPDAQAKQDLFAAVKRSETKMAKSQRRALATGKNIKPPMFVRGTLVPPTNLDFLSISLENPETKFAVFKRIVQITGHRIPDNLIPSIKTVADLLNHLHLASKPKPEKLAQSLAADERLKSLPNVKIMGRRFTPIDKEKEIGRWKVIEEELTRRNLPVTGQLPIGVPR